MKTDRLPLPDLLKGFAVFLIVPVHILQLFIDHPGRESLFGKSLFFMGGPVAAPVFMLVMGYFLAKSKNNPRKIMLRGIKVFVVGLLLNIGLNFNLLLKIKYQGWPYNPLEYLFGVDILCLAGLSILFIAFLRIIKKGQAWIALVFVFLVTGLTGNMNELLMTTDRNYILPFIAGSYSWSYFPLFPWLAYPLIGFTFFHWEEKIMLFFAKHKLIAGIILTGISTLVILFVKWGVNTTINLTEYYHHTFGFSIWATGIIILWILLIKLLHHRFPNTTVGNHLMWLGKNITLFYVIQWLIIGNIATSIYQSQSINHFIFWFSGIFTVTVFLTWVIGKTNLNLAR